MSLFERMGHRRNAVIGAAVVGVSLVWAIAPAAAATASRTTLSTSTPTVNVGSAAKLKAVVRPVSGTVLPTGTVTFREGTTATSPAVGPAVTLTTVNSVQTAKIDVSGLAIGTHTFIATYSGSATFNASTSLTTSVVVQAVAKINTTTTATMSTPVQVAPGDEVKLKAVVKQASGTVKPTGSVTFSQGGTPIAPAVPLVVGTTSSAKLTITTLTAGSHSIIATYSGSQAFNASASSPAITVSVGKIDTTSTLTTHPSTTDPTSTVMAVEVTASNGTVPTGVVNFVLDGSAPQPYQLTATGKAQFSKAFTSGSLHTVSVTYDGTTVYNGSSATLTFTAP